MVPSMYSPAAGLLPTANGSSGAVAGRVCPAAAVVADNVASIQIASVFIIATP